MASIVVVSANIQGGALTGEHAWRDRSDLCASVIQGTNADLVGFQEFHVCNAAAFEPLLATHHLELGLDEGNGMRPNTILWRDERFTLLDKGGFGLSPNQELARAWDAEVPRACSWLHLFDVITRRELLFLNTHLDHIGSQARKEGSRVIIDFLAAFPPNIPIVITGDFNSSPWAPKPSPSHSRTVYDLWKTKGFTHSWESVHGPQWPTTFHDYQGSLYTGDAFSTWHIDWIMVKNLQVVSTRIVRDSKRPVYPSDHYPVRALLEY